MNNVFDLIIIGGGLIGLSTAYKIQKNFPKKNILLLEKEKEFGRRGDTGEIVIKIDKR